MAQGLVARIGRWCFRRRWWVLAGWLVIFLFGVTLPGRLFAGLGDDPTPTSAESSIGRDMLDRALNTSGQVIGLVDRLDPQAPAVRTAIRRAADDLARLSYVSQVETPYAASAEGWPKPVNPTDYLSRDGRGLLVIATLNRLDPAQRDNAASAIAHRLHALTLDLHDGGQPEARVRVGGDPYRDYQTRQAAQEDLIRGEAVALPIALLVLIFLCGGLAAAALPLGTAAVSIGSAMVVLLSVKQVTDLHLSMVSVVTILGLGLSIDYGLLLVGRYREELGADHTPEDAVARAWATSGRGIVFSALTVAAVLSAMLMFEITALSAIGVAGISVAIAAMLVSLTFTAALLGLSSGDISARKAPAHGKRGRHVGSTGFFGGLAKFAQQRAAAVALMTTIGLLAAAAPLIGAHVRLPGLSAGPRGTESVQVADELDRRFGRPTTVTITVLARTEPSALTNWAIGFSGSPAIARIGQPTAVSETLSTIDIFLGRDGQSDATQDLVRRMRATRPAGGPSWVIGDAATLVDAEKRISDALPAAVGVAALALVVLLFALTGSLVLPVKVILAGVVWLGAVVGLMSAIFESGLLSGPLATLTVSGLDPFTVVLVCAIGFALSIGHGVLLLGRITEHVARGRHDPATEISRRAAITDAAVGKGLGDTGQIVASAALLLLIVFAGLAAATVSRLEQIGIGLAIAVLLDVVVLCLLLPATLTLLGRWTWWAPAPLARLHRRFTPREWAPPAEGGPGRAEPSIRRPLAPPTEGGPGRVEPSIHKPLTPARAKARPAGSDTARLPRTGAGPGLLTLLAVERRKLGATRTIWWLLLGAAALAVVATVAMFILFDKNGLPLNSDKILRNAMHGAGAGTILVIVAGVMGMAGEFRFGQADQTFLSSPNRVRVFVAKAITYALTGLAFGTCSSLVTVVTSWIWLRGRGLDLPVERPVVWLTLVGTVIAAALYAMLGVAVGGVSRNQVVAIVGTLAWLIAVEPVLVVSIPTVARYLPGSAGLALERAPNDALLAMLPGGLVFGAYVAIALLGGAWRTVREDIR